MSSPRGTLIIFGRVPRPGRVKTRLMPGLSAEEACRLHVALLGDVLQLASAALAGSCRMVLAWSEPVVPGSTDVEIPDGVEERTQSGGDLGERMAAAIQEEIKGGARGVVVLGSDLPTLPGDHLVSAFEALERCQVVLGPARDGGYYLVGMSRLHPEIFRGIRWGSPEVMQVTRKRLKQAGVQWEELGAWGDVDTMEDVAALWRELLRLKARHPGQVPARTWAVMAGLGAGRFGG